MPARDASIMKSLNLNYLRGLYDFLFEKSDGELESFDINLPANRKALFEEMKRSFSEFGPVSKSNVIDGLCFLISNYSDDLLWRSAVPHDLPLNVIVDRGGYLKEVLAVLVKDDFLLADPKDFVLIDEVGPTGLDFSK